MVGRCCRFASLAVKSSFSLQDFYLMFLMSFAASICFKRVSHILVLDLVNLTNLRATD